MPSHAAASFARIKPSSSLGVSLAAGETEGIDKGGLVAKNADGLPLNLHF